MVLYHPKQATSNQNICSTVFQNFSSVYVLQIMNNLNLYYKQYLDLNISLNSL